MALYVTIEFLVVVLNLRLLVEFKLIGWAVELTLLSEYSESVPQLFSSKSALNASTTLVYETGGAKFKDPR
jgi:hypothetical protein